jgi:hypothetical protein
MKHNKKRNTAFLYEILVKELTKSIVREDKDRQSVTKKILVEFFSKGSPLRDELAIYHSVFDASDIDKKHHARLLKEAKIDFSNLSRKEIFNKQTALINAINKQLGSGVYSNFVPNYKDIATAGIFFQGKGHTAKSRIILEEKMLSILSPKKEGNNELQHIDNLTYKSFVKRFNETYDRTLRQEQKELLTNYIVSFSDNGLGLKSFLNEEIGRLKNAVDAEIVEGTNVALTENFQKVRAKLDSYTQAPLNQQIVEEIFYIQDLIAEVSRNGN